MFGSKTIGVLALACLTGMSGAAQHQPAVTGASLLPQAAASPQKNPTQKSAARGAQRQRRAGDWLRAHQDLPLDQQQKLLESDPNFKKLPPDRQAALRERLRKFNSLTPEQRARALQRMDFMSSLTQDQRHQLREANRQLEGLPPERRVMVHKALRHLRQMDPQQRAEVLQSEHFRSTFSDQEQGILKELSAINPPGEGPAPAASQQPR